MTPRQFCIHKKIKETWWHRKSLKYFWNIIWCWFHLQGLLIIEPGNQNETFGSIHDWVILSSPIAHCICRSINWCDRLVIDIIIIMFSWLYGNGFIEWKTSAIMPICIDVSQNKYKKRRLLLLWWQSPL